MVRIVRLAIGGGWTSEGGPDRGVGEVPVTDRFERASVSAVLWWGLDCCFLCLLNVADRGCLVCHLGAVGGVSVIFTWSVISSMCGVCQGVLGQICFLDIEGVVVLEVLDFPSFFARYPSDDTASESVDGSVGDKVGDDYLVSSFNRCLLSRWRWIVELFWFRVLFRFEVRHVWCSWRGPFGEFFCILLLFQASCVFPVGYTLFDAIDRVLKRKCVADFGLDVDVSNGRVEITPAG